MDIVAAIKTNPRGKELDRLAALYGYQRQKTSSFGVYVRMETDREFLDRVSTESLLAGEFYGPTPFGIRMPPKVAWLGYIGGNPGKNLAGTIAFEAAEGRQPNRFHRWMQYLVLGIYWARKT